MRSAIEQALSLDCSDAAAIRHLLQAPNLVRARGGSIELGALLSFERPLPVLTDYDELLDAGGGVMSAQTAVLEAATIRQQCKVLHLPTVAAHCAQLAEQAVRERRTHLAYLEALLQAELEDLEHQLAGRRLRDPHLPRMKTLEEFDLSKVPLLFRSTDPRTCPGVTLAKAEPVIFIGKIDPAT